MPEINSDDIISRVMMSHVASELRSYQGNLTHAVHIIANGWLPDIDDPVVAPHIDTLRGYLAENGTVEDDRFLLRLGLTIPGMQRGIVPPLMVLEPNRGGFSSRRQREAAGQISRLREALAIGRRFLPSLNPDTETAIVELADLPQLQSRPDDGEWLESYGRLANAEADKLAAKAMECLESGEKSVYDVGERALQHLACFRQSPLDEAIGLALIERAVFWPSSLYRESGERTAERLVKAIEGAVDRASLDHRLLALAWTRSGIAEQSFRDWTSQPPRWAEGLYVPPAEYMTRAGWCLDEDGQARDLVSKQCFRLRPATEADSVVHARSQIDDFCPSCNTRLVWLLDFSGCRRVLEDTGLVEAPTTVLGCLNCACYGPVFARYSADGTAEFLSTTESADKTDVQPDSRYLTPIPCPRFACAEPFSLDDASTVGGVPMWLQDAEYPRCIECDRYMSFLAQHDNGPLGEEGIYYAFYCACCRISAISYQQT